MTIDTNLVIGIISAIVALVGGGGGILAFVSSRQKNNNDKYSSSVSEWQELYNEMKKRLDEQEESNAQLRAEVFKLREEINKLNIELNNYKNYEYYIKDLEIYTDTLLSHIKTYVTDEAYKAILSKRPQKIEPVAINDNNDEDNNDN